MVPFLHAILGTMLPMLGMAKLDNMKWVFSAGESLRCHFGINPLKPEFIIGISLHYKTRIAIAILDL